MGKFDDDFISHHGVKGQKWGVRRYRQERKGAKQDDKKIRQDDADALREARKAVSSEKKAAEAQSLKKVFKKGSDQYKKYESKEKNYTEQGKAHDAAGIQYKRNADKAAKSFQKHIRNAANLPVSIQMRPKSKQFKIALKQSGALLLTSATRDSDTMLSALRGASSPTKNDMFAEMVDAAQRKKR